MQWPPEARARVERREAEGLGLGRFDDFPDVDAHLVEGHLQLVDQGDVDRAEDVLEQLRRLGHAGRRHRHHLVDRQPRRGRRPLPWTARSRRRPPSGCSSCGTSGCPGLRVRARTPAGSRRASSGPWLRARAARLRRSSPDTSSTRARPAAPCAGAWRRPWRCRARRTGRARGGGPSGVGTQIRTASHVASSSKSTLAVKTAGLHRGRHTVGANVLDVRLAAVERVHLDRDRGRGRRPGNPASTNTSARGRPT